jgi:SAM-dependent methyltransferase
MQYSINYDSEELRGTDNPLTPRPWNITSKLKEYADNSKTLLDVGCGTCFKTIPLSPNFKSIYGIDTCHDMLNKARMELKRSQVSNYFLINGDSNFMPFRDNSFNIITCILSRWSPKELARVIDQNGVMILEHIGCEDKKDFKLLFGSDEYGLRGQFIDFEKEQYIDMLYSSFSEFFHKVVIKEGYWNTFYTYQGLLELLSHTPTIRNYNKNDTITLDNFVQKNNKQGLIELTQNRILIYASDKK